MMDTLVTKAKGFLLSPVETFRQSAGDEPGAVFTYFTVLLLINAILSALVAAAGVHAMRMFAGMSFGVALPVLVFFMVLVGGFIVTLIIAAWIHLWVYLLGGRKGIMQTIRAVLYGNTPRLLLGWIPLVGLVFALWSLVLTILGVRELQELSPGKAVLAVAIAIIIPLAVIVLLAAYFLMSYMAVGPVPVPPSNIF